MSWAELADQSASYALRIMALESQRVVLRTALAQSLITPPGPKLLALIGAALAATEEKASP